MDNKKKFQLLNLPTEYMMLIVLVVLCIILSLLKPAFYSAFNVSTLIRTISWTTIVAFGQTLVLLTGGIDLSVAGMAGMSGILSAWFMVNAGISIALDKGFSNTKAMLARKLQVQGEVLEEQRKANAEQEAKIQNLEAENAAIKAQNAKLEARLAAIEAKLGK